MKYIIFDKSAVEYITCTKEMQSIEFEEGKLFIRAFRGDEKNYRNSSLYFCMTKAGIIFSGAEKSKTIIAIDLETSGLLKNEKSDEKLLLVLQKTFRTALRIWNQLPFTSSEKIHETKTIIFPFVFPNPMRIVIERSPNCERLYKRNIIRPLLVYKYNKEDAPRVEEIPSVNNLEEAGQDYLSKFSEIYAYFHTSAQSSASPSVSTSLILETSDEYVGDGGFNYLKYEIQLSKLTATQKSVVNNTNTTSPIRVEGPAGTGKTVSMILRAYRILEEKRVADEHYKILFIAHSESTRNEIHTIFSVLENASLYLSATSKQRIIITTLFQYCVEELGLEASQIIESDAMQAKQSQKVLIADAVDKVISEKYITYRSVLSPEFKNLFEEDKTPRGVLVSLLQHEFSVQIKGRTDGSIEEYSALSSIANALPAITDNEKKFVYCIYQEYQKMLATLSVFDNDDITVAALSKWNAPIWRRERANQGFDYIFVDEMHLFSLNEQHAFHYLTTDLNQKIIPICFALDYSQAIGDRGDISQDYIEKEFGEAVCNNYKTVFRSSQQITDFCASISASGAHMFQSYYRNPYESPASGFTSQEESWCSMPELHMYEDEETMMNSIKTHVDIFKKELHCKNSEIAIITFEEKLLYLEHIEALSQKLNKEIRHIKDREIINQANMRTTEDQVILSSPYNVNGLEFKCVILVGVDEGRVPPNAGVSDISANYVKYSAFNQLYLSASRAKFRLILIGNALHGVSSCLQYAIKNNRIICITD